MKDVHMAGVIMNTSIRQLDAMLKHLFEECDYATKAMEEIYVECSDFDLYIQDDNTIREGYVEGNYNYLLSGIHNGGVEATEKLLKTMVAVLDQHQLIYTFEYYEEDGEEYIIRHDKY